MNPILNVYADGIRHVKGVVAPRSQALPKKRRMTLIVGIICKDGIVIGSDSQSTNSDMMARTDATKIYEIALSDKSRGLVATAGSVEWSLQVIEIMEELAKSATLSRARAFADLAEEANTRIKQRERRPLRRSSRDLATHFAENRCVLMIANYYEGAPYLYTLPSDGLVSPTLLTKQLYASIGNSYALANYLLRKFDIANMMTGTASVVAAYVVNEVIQAKDSSCDHPIQLAMVGPKAPPGYYDSKESHTIFLNNSFGKMMAEKVIAETKHIESETASRLGRVCVEVADFIEQEKSRLEVENAVLRTALEELRNQQSHE